MKRRLLSIVLAAAMILGMLPLSALPVWAADTPIPGGTFGSGQDGSFDHPYQISRVSQVPYMDAKYGKHCFVLMSNLNFGHQKTRPVEKFTGQLEGNGHTISNLDASLFGEMEKGSRAENLHFKDGRFDLMGPTPDGEGSVNYSEGGSGGYRNFRDVKFGFLAGVGYGSVNNVTVSDAVIDVSYYSYAPVGSIGFIVGRGYGLTNCTVNSCTVRYACLMGNVGGLVGYAESNGFYGCAVEDLLWVDVKAQTDAQEQNASFKDYSNNKSAGAFVGISYGLNLRCCFVHNIQKCEEIREGYYGVRENAGLCLLGFNRDSQDHSVRIKDILLPKNGDKGIAGGRTWVQGQRPGNGIDDADIRAGSMEYEGAPDMAEYNKRAEGYGWESILPRNTSHPYWVQESAYTPELKPAPTKARVTISAGEYDESVSYIDYNTAFTMPYHTSYIDNSGPCGGWPGSFADEWIVTDEHTGAQVAVLRAKLNGSSNAYTLDRSILVKNRYANQNYYYTSGQHHFGTEYTAGFFRPVWYGNGEGYHLDPATVEGPLADKIGQPGKGGNYWFLYQKLDSRGYQQGQPVETITEPGRYRLVYGLKPGFDRSYALADTWFRRPDGSVTEMWNLAPLQKGSLPIANAVAGYTGKGIAADIPLLRQEGVTGLSIQYESDTYSKTNQAPTEKGTYKVYVTVDRYEGGSTYNACWDASKDVYLGDMTISDAGLRVIVDGQVADSGFSILCDSGASATMEAGIIKLPEMAAGTGYTLRKIVEGKHIDVLRVIHDGEPSAVLTLSTVTVSAANDGLPGDSYGCAKDATAALGLVEHFTDHRNLLPTQYIRQYLLPSDAMLDTLILRTPKVPTMQGGKEYLPFRCWVDKDRKPVDLHTTSAAALGGVLLATYEPLVAPDEKALGLEVGSTYYLLDTDSCISAPYSIGSDLSNLTGGKRLIPMIYAGGYRADLWSEWSEWDPHIKTNSQFHTGPFYRFLSRDAYERPALSLYQGGGETVNQAWDGMLPHAEGCYNEFVFFGIPTAGVLRQDIKDKQVGSLGLSTSFATAANPWNDRTQMWLTLGDAAGVRSPSGLESAREGDFPHYGYDPLKSYVLTGSRGQALLTDTSHFNDTIGMRFTADITRGTQNRCLVVTLDLGEWAAGEEKRIQLLQFCDPDPGDTYILPESAVFLDLLKPGAGAWEDEVTGRTYESGDAVPSTVTRLRAVPSAVKTLTEADCDYYGLNHKYVGWYGAADELGLKSLLSGFAKKAHADKKMVLLQDITLSDEPFSVDIYGTFDGAGHTLTNVPHQFIHFLRGHLTNIHFESPKGIVVGEISNTTMDFVWGNNTRHPFIGMVSGTVHLTRVHITNFLTEGPEIYTPDHNGLDMYGVLVNNVADWGTELYLLACTTQGRDTYTNSNPGDKERRYYCSGMVCRRAPTSQSSNGPRFISFERCRSELMFDHDLTDTTTFTQFYSDSNWENHLRNLKMMDCIAYGNAPYCCMEPHYSPTYWRCIRDGSQTVDFQPSNTTFYPKYCYSDPTDPYSAWTLNTHDGTWKDDQGNLTNYQFFGFDEEKKRVDFVWDGAARVYKTTFKDKTGGGNADDNRAVYGIFTDADMPDWAKGKKLVISGTDTSVVPNETYLTEDTVIDVLSASAPATSLAEIETAPAVSPLTYTGQAQDLAAPGAGKAGAKITYALTEAGPYTDQIPQGTKVGEYSFFYRAEASGKLNSQPQKLTVSIAPTPITNASARQVGQLVLWGDFGQRPQVTTTTHTTVGNFPISYSFSLSETGGFASAPPEFSTPVETTVYFRATAKNHSPATGSFPVSVIAAKEQNISYAVTELTKTYGDASFRNPLTVTLAQGALSYESSDPKVAAVASDGTVTLTGAGTATITAVAARTDTHNRASAAYTLTVKPAQAQAVITGDVLIYDGKTLHPQIRVTAGDQLLSPDEYTVSYQLNRDGTLESAHPDDVKPLGSYKVTVSQKAGGRYTLQEVSQGFQIVLVRADWKDNELEIRLSETLDEGSLLSAGYRSDGRMTAVVMNGIQPTDGVQLFTVNRKTFADATVIRIYVLDGKYLPVISPLDR